MQISKKNIIKIDSMINKIIKLYKKFDDLTFQLKILSTN